MPAPLVYTYSAAAKIAAHTAFRDLIDSGAGPGLIRIRDESDVLLAEAALDDPCGTVNGTTGQLTFIIDAGEDASSAGTAAYGEFCDSDGDVHLALPCEAGAVAVSGKLVLSNLTLLAGGAVEIISATIG